MVNVLHWSFVFGPPLHSPTCANLRTWNLENVQSNLCITMFQFFTWFNKWIIIIIFASHLVRNSLSRILIFLLRGLRSFDAKQDPIIVGTPQYLGPLLARRPHYLHVAIARRIPIFQLLRLPPLPFHANYQLIPDHGRSNLTKIFLGRVSRLWGWAIRWAGCGWHRGADVHLWTILEISKRLKKRNLIRQSRLKLS